MLATDLSPEIWNSIADLVQRTGALRELYFVKVTKVDKKRKVIWATDFGDLAIPLVAHNFGFSYFDTQPTGANVVAGVPLPTKLVKQQDTTNENSTFHVEIIPPKVGQMAVVYDLWGAKRFPICIGVIQSRDFWEEK